MVSADPLAVVVDLLDRAAIPYTLAGSFASTCHGSPRTTHDIDVVIAPTRPVLDRFVDGLDEERYYMSDVAVDEVWQRRGMFNVLLLDSGWKVDLILRKDRPFSRSEFERRIRVELGGLAVWMATAEDTILAKLEWAKAGESERQLRDVVGILEVAGGRLDRAYIERWVAELGLLDLWARVGSKGS
jgi:predicted nucleotidyltransferase